MDRGYQAAHQILYYRPRESRDASYSIVTADSEAQSPIKFQIFGWFSLRFINPKINYRKLGYELVGCHLVGRLK